MTKLKIKQKFVIKDFKLLKKKNYSKTYTLSFINSFNKQRLKNYKVPICLVLFGLS